MELARSRFVSLCPNLSDLVSSAAALFDGRVSRDDLPDAELRASLRGRGDDVIPCVFRDSPPGSPRKHGVITTLEFRRHHTYGGPQSEYVVDRLHSSTLPLIIYQRKV